MRILIVSPYVPPEGGGLERYALAMAEQLSHRGHVVHMVAATRHVPYTTRTPRLVIERLPATRFVGNSPIMPGLGRHLSRIIDEEAPDVVWGHTPVPGPAHQAYAAAARHGVPFVVTYHAGRLRGSTAARQLLAQGIAHTVDRGMLRGANGRMAVSQHVRNVVFDGLPDAPEAVVPPGVDTSVFRPTKRRNGSKDSPQVLFVAPVDRSYRWKGLDVLLAAWSKVRSTHPTACLHVVGAGDREESLRRQHRGDSILFHGRSDLAGLITRYQAADCVVLPSTTDAEAFGMVLAEANACGRPVVASRIGGIPSFVRDGVNGRLCEPGDPASLAATINKLLDDPGAADDMGARGRDIVLRHHQWAELAGSVEHLLAQAANQRTSRIHVPAFGTDAATAASNQPQVTA